MQRWKPVEVLIHKDVRKDPVVLSIRNNLRDVRVDVVESGLPQDVMAASRTLGVRTSLFNTITEGKKVLYVGPPGDVVDDFSIPDGRMVCPHFARLKLASNGCFYRCDWCYLKGTYRANRPYITAHVEYPRIEQQLQGRLRNSPEPILFNAGELADSLSMDHVMKAAEHFISWFGRQKKGYLLLLTKSDNVDHILHLPHNRQTIVAWSMNAPAVSRQFEKGAPSFQRRLEAARKVQEAGYDVRIRLDPIVPVDGWQEIYADAIRDIYAAIEPERVTLGTLRFEEQFYHIRKTIVSEALLRHMETMAPMFTPQPVRMKNRKTTTKSGKYSFSHEERAAIFKFAVKEIRKHSPKAKIALCKESAAVWEAVNLNLSRCWCVCQLGYANMS
ncbi:MAG: spore photoproduct lyase family protein [Syntrophorhabdales bacterium]|jgi:spore photoproduct lyase